jgi:hypothetical protein
MASDHQFFVRRNNVKRNTALGDRYAGGAWAELALASRTAANQPSFAAMRARMAAEFSK